MKICAAAARRLSRAGLMVAFGFVCSFPTVAAPATGGSVDFQHDIAPLFKTSCVACHSGDMAQGGLRLDSEAAVLRGGVSGKAIVPGDSGGSLLVKRLLGMTDAPRMPMGRDPLTNEQVKLVRTWIDHGDFSAALHEIDHQPAAVASHSPATSASNSPFFAEKVRPILAARCYQCHGPDVHQDGLRLDSLDGILKGAETGKVVIPGKSDQSRLIRRLIAAERPQMPYGGPPLSDEQVKTIRQWIDAGAPGPDGTTPLAAAKPLKHWAYVKPVHPPAPPVKDSSWVRNPIDNFVLAKLEKEGLKPSSEADKPILIRRVYLDLIGIPPTPQQVDAFVNDTSPNAYEKVVDQLLASPRYGERWARPWLDLARYADTNGYEKDVRRTAWKFRDWVIDALNKDMSFKEFTIEQIAGDMLPHPTPSQLIATGFHRNTMLNQEGGVDPEEYYWYSLVDRVNTTSAVWLGSTLGCAECHNHKFDPFTQKDYYRFLAFFANSKYTIGGPSLGRYAVEPELEMPTPEQSEKLKELRSQIEAVRVTLDTQTPQLTTAQTTWESRMANIDKEWDALHPATAESSGGATLKILPDNSVLATGKNPQADNYKITSSTSKTGLTAVRIEVLPDASLPHGGPGRDAEGNFFLSDFEVQAEPADHSAPARTLHFKTAEADESQDGYNIHNLLIQDMNLRGWAIDASPTPKPLRRQAVFIPDEPFGFPGGTLLTVRMKHAMRHASRNIGHFRLSITAAQDPLAAVELPARLWPVLETPAAQRSTEDRDRLAAAYRAVSPLLDAQRKLLKNLQQADKAIPVETAMIMGEKPTFTRPATYIRERGSFMSKGDEVYADVPSALNPLTGDEMPNRLGLAKWLVSEDNPLTARVTVNRYWESFFGHGIVETTEDFGSQGDLPTHPELLDWLATEFMHNGWSMKAIKRLIVTSATYRQSSKVTPELEARDPYNKLLARGPRFRVEAEMVHDIALAASGLLSDKMYGPSVFPYQPDGIWDVPYSSDKWVQSKGQDQYRRAIYTFMRRSAPYPSLSTFDAPSREFCTVRRVRTNTPLQALTTLNDPLFFAAARAMAVRLMKEAGPDVNARLTYGFRLAVSRRPTTAELHRLVAFYDQQIDEFKKDQKAAKLVQATDAPASDPAELAAWTMVSNVLLNMDETVSKE